MSLFRFFLTVTTFYIQTMPQTGSFIYAAALGAIMLVNPALPTSKYCEWSRTGGTSFYEDDWISARSARLLIR